MNSNVRKWQVAQYAYSPQARKGARSQENGWKTSPGSPEILLSWPGGDQRPSRGGSLVVFNFSFFLRFLLVSIRDSSYSFFRPSNSCYYSLTTRKDHFIIAKTITQNKRRQNILLGKICCVCGGYAGWLVLSPFWSTYMFVIFLIWLCTSCLVACCLWYRETVFFATCWLWKTWICCEIEVVYLVFADFELLGSLSPFSCSVGHGYWSSLSSRLYLSLAG